MFNVEHSQVQFMGWDLSVQQYFLFPKPQVSGWASGVLLKLWFGRPSWFMKHLSIWLANSTQIYNFKQERLTKSHEIYMLFLSCFATWCMLKR